MTKEIWKPIPGLEGYEASNLGRVRSFRSRNGVGMTKVPHLLKPSKIKNKPYLRYGFGTGKGKVEMKAHVVTLITFVGPRPSPNHDGCHNDGDPTNNALSNVRWDTKKGNAADREKHGTQPKGSKSSRSELTEEQVAEIKAALPNWKHGMGRYFAKKFGVGDSAIHDIKTGRTWSHL